MTDRSARLEAAALRVEAAARAGCVKLWRTRTTRTLVGVYRSYEAGLETDESLPWSTVCEEHGYLVCSSSRRIAEAAALDRDWCEVCSDEQAAASQADIAVAESGRVR